ncbi:MAG TPA: hypothetical protein VE244_01190 [Nitrososphaeraceae archaeon]|nr:hypothetical protein [Nitrososphaeraceae archaeon]
MSAARSNVKTSFIDRTPESTLKKSVSFQSIDELLHQSMIDLSPLINRIGGTSMAHQQNIFNEQDK